MCTRRGEIWGIWGRFVEIRDDDRTNGYDKYVPERISSRYNLYAESE